ncbi:glutamate--cysteine ligase, partial [Vibrio coralliirubri]
MTDFAARLKQVATNPKTFSQFGRGVERETLRYTEDGHLATGPHPEALGSALMNEWVTT